jgi:hypothetical protein
MKPSKVCVTAEDLCSMYIRNLNATFINKCVHFQSYDQSIKNSLLTIIVRNTMLKIKELEDICLYVNIALHMFLCTPCSNCTSNDNF